MTESDLNRIEQVLNISLPREYRAVVSRYPFAPNSSLADYALPNDADRVIEMNVLSRECEWDSEASPIHWFVFGHDGGECSYFLDLTRPNSPVFAISIEGGGPSEEAPTLADFIEINLQIDEEGDREFAEKAAWRKARKWWQFWK